MLLAPIDFHATAGIPLGADANLLNEMRASGGAALGAGVVILLGAFIASIRPTSIILATTLYLSYGAARIISMVVDGAPGATLQLVAALEIGIGAMCAFALIRRVASTPREAPGEGR
jgi:hypothetical protein